MTERLRQLLGDEAGGLDVPPPATNEVIRQGRGMRRRNRMTVAVGAAAAAVVVGGSVVALAGGDGEGTAPDPASPPVDANPVFAYGTHVFYDGPGHQAEIQDKAIKSLYYTSAGVLVRHGNNSYSDGGGPQRFSLVTPDGDVRPLGLVTEETVHASDTDQPYVVYGEAVDGELQVVVYDVVTDTEAARVTVGPTGDSWFPIAIDGDTVYVQNGYDNGVSAVDWNASTATESSVDSVWDVAGGRYATSVDSQAAIVDAKSGEVVLTADGGYFDLSPDGRYAELVNEEEESMPGSEVELEVYDVATGSSVTIAGPAYDWGWTADGDLFRAGKDRIWTCDSATGECKVELFEMPADVGRQPELRLGGQVYES